MITLTIIFIVILIKLMVFLFVGTVKIMGDVAIGTTVVVGSAVAALCSTNSDQVKTGIIDGRKRYYFNGTLVDFDTLEGIEFEQFVADMLTQLGYTDVHTTPANNDYGVDVIATLGNDKYVFQCKRYSSKVANSAVQEVHTGKDYYDADVAVVVTNNYFTDNAKELARKTGVELWDRSVLEKKVSEAYINTEQPSQPSNENPKTDSNDVYYQKLNQTEPVTDAIRYEALNDETRSSHKDPQKTGLNLVPLFVTILSISLVLLLATLILYDKKDDLGMSDYKKMKVDEQIEASKPVYVEKTQPTEKDSLDDLDVFCMNRYYLPANGTLELSLEQDGEYKKTIRATIGGGSNVANDIYFSIKELYASLSERYPDYHIHIVHIGAFDGTTKYPKIATLHYQNGDYVLYMGTDLKDNTVYNIEDMDWLQEKYTLVDTKENQLQEQLKEAFADFTNLCDEKLGMNTEHDYWVTQTAPATCKQYGTLTYRCKDCDVEFTELLPQTEDHNYVKESVKSPTCFEHGETTYKCSICGSLKSEGIPSPGHQPEWVVVKEPSLFINGKEVYMCSACQESYGTRVIKSKYPAEYLTGGIGLLLMIISVMGLLIVEKRRKQLNAATTSPS